MDGKSLNITDEKLRMLKEIIPEAFTENKIDWEKLKAALSDDIKFKNNNQLKINNALQMKDARIEFKAA